MNDCWILGLNPWVEWNGNGVQWPLGNFMNLNSKMTSLDHDYLLWYFDKFASWGKKKKKERKEKKEKNTLID